MKETNSNYTKSPYHHYELRWTTLLVPIPSKCSWSLHVFFRRSRIVL